MRVLLQEYLELAQTRHAASMEQGSPMDYDHPFPAVARTRVDLCDEAVVRSRATVRLHGGTTSVSPLVVGVKESGDGR